jgi:hypothetical protein
MVMKVNGTNGLTFPDTTTLASAGQSSVQAWVNFNGTGTVAIRASYNVSSITDNGTGDYTVNFTTAMPDANYAVSGSAGTDLASTVIAGVRTQALATGSVRVLAAAASALGDYAQTHVAIFR